MFGHRSSSLLVVSSAYIEAFSKAVASINDSGSKFIFKVCVANQVDRDVANQVDRYVANQVDRDVVNQVDRDVVNQVVNMVYSMNQEEDYERTKPSTAIYNG